MSGKLPARLPRPVDCGCMIILIGDYIACSTLHFVKNMTMNVETSSFGYDVAIEIWCNEFLQLLLEDVWFHNYVF